MTELDATAGYRLMWRGKDTSNIIFVDKRVKCKPDVVCDSRFLPFRDHCFLKVYCDPPHLIYAEDKKSCPLEKANKKFLRAWHYEHGVYDLHSLLEEKYGHWRSKTAWINFLFHINKEFSRALSKNGVLVLKIIDGVSNHAINFRQVKELLTNFTISPGEAIRNSHDCATDNKAVKNKALWFHLSPRIQGGSNI